MALEPRKGGVDEVVSLGGAREMMQAERTPRQGAHSLAGSLRL